MPSEQMSAPSLRSGFLRSHERFPNRTALEVNGQCLTYDQLYQQAASLAATLQQNEPSDDPPLTASLGYRSPAAFAGVLAALFRGHGYVPLNPNFPPDRTSNMLQRSGCRAVIVDSTGEKQLEQILEGIDLPLLLIFPERQEVVQLIQRWPQHRLLGADDLVPASELEWGSVNPNAIAYVLFTSGSTGLPKGVMVSHRNINHFIDVMVDRYKITENDRFSQMFEMVFDLSLFDMFVAWKRGARVCCPSKMQLLTPTAYISQSKITIWFSVPSVALLMKKLGLLTKDAYPDLRLSLFCGEALQADIASTWALAAPNTIIENLYGPTELTLACTLYRWDEHRSPAQCENGIVPIGEPYPGMSVLVADESLQEVQPGQAGELLMSGPQVALGYWQDPQKTDAAFVTPPGKETVHYRTGDLARRPKSNAPLIYMGRVDNQIKIHGNRVELGEIEAALRQAAEVDQAVAVGWPVTPSGVEGIVAFLGTAQKNQDPIRDTLKARLPSYMIPREIRCMPNLPLNSNGKVDRKALLKTLENGN